MLPTLRRKRQAALSIRRPSSGCHGTQKPWQHLFHERRGPVLEQHQRPGRVPGFKAVQTRPRSNRTKRGSHKRWDAPCEGGGDGAACDFSPGSVDPGVHPTAVGGLQGTLNSPTSSRLRKGTFQMHQELKLDK